MNSSIGVFGAASGLRFFSTRAITSPPRVLCARAVGPVHGTTTTGLRTAVASAPYICVFRFSPVKSPSARIDAGDSVTVTTPRHPRDLAVTGR